MADRTPTMRDVAELAGVSIQTVSCVVNEKGNISPRTRKRVLKAIAELHYRPHHIARSMRTRQTGLLGLLVLDITNPVHSVIASAVESAANERGYKVVLNNVAMSVERERQCLEASAEGLVDGLIIVNTVNREGTFAFLEETNLPAVLIDCLTSKAIPTVSVDNFQAAYIATQHAIALGHRRIAHLAGSTTQWIAQQRIQGYRQALADSRLSYERVLVAPIAGWDYRAGYQTMIQLLDERERPTAVFAASDEMAIGAYRALNEAGLRVPQDLSVIGFDDIVAASYAAPPLTTIHQPFHEMAVSAVMLLVDLIMGQAVDTIQRTLAPELVIRESTREVDDDGR